MKNSLRGSKIFKMIFGILMGLGLFLLLYILIFLFINLYPFSVYVATGLLAGYFGAVLVNTKKQ